MAEDARSDAALLLTEQFIQVPFLPGQLPGSDPDDNEEGIPQFTGGIVEPPVKPKRVMKAVATNGALAAVCAAVADGTAGVRYDIVPRFKKRFAGDKFKEFDVNDPSTWPPEAKEQRRMIQVMIQAGFLGQGAKSLRSGFKQQEHDRVILGWGGVGVLRTEFSDNEDMPPTPKGFTRFQACLARFTRPDRTPTMVPVPIALEDGTVWWIEEPRFFRRIRVTTRNGRTIWFKQYGDWRSMSSKTGKYSTGNRHEPSDTPGKPGKYKPGRLPEGHSPAMEVMHWATSFPGADPYGLSQWHSEIKSADAATQQTDLVLEYLKSGLHSIILAAANRPFDDATVEAAVDKIDELGRGRKGLGALITLALVPTESDSVASTMPFQDETTTDKGRLILHQLTTRLPAEILRKEGLQESLGSRFSNAERIPALLLGKSDSYNFATASAAWAVVNRLRFGPHFEEREQFLDRILVEMGITFWRIKVVSPEWDEKEPLSGVMSVAGQLGGVSVNRALELVGDVMDVEFKPISSWWGNHSMSIVNSVLTSKEPAKMAELLGIEDFPSEVLAEDVSDDVMSMLEDMRSKLEQALRDRGVDTDTLEDEEDEGEVDDGPGPSRPVGRPPGT